MRIAVVSIGSFDTQYSDYHIMRDIIVGLLERGHTVDLIQKQYLDVPQYPKQFEEYLGKELSIQNIPFTKRAKTNLKARYMADLDYYRKACRIMKECKPDKVFLQSNNTAFFTVFYAKHLLKCPILYNEQDIFPENAYFAEILSEKSVVYRIAHALQKYAYKNATELCTISEDMKATIISRYHIPEERVKVIYNWGHEELKAHSEEKNTFLQKYPKKPEEFRVLYAGNLGKMQNVELVLRTAAMMKEQADVSFFVVGSGVNEENLKEFARKNKLENVTFVDMIPADQVADLYAAADVCVIPLQKGLIYAALPSKTADCLLTGKNAIFCIDEESIFSGVLEQYNIMNAGSSSPEQLKRLIEMQKKEHTKSDFYGLWKTYFTREKNVEQYCTLVEMM